MEAMRSCLLNGFVVVFVSTSVATARTAKSTRDPGIATRLRKDRSRYSVVYFHAALA